MIGEGVKMTVIVLTEHKGYYYLHGDGRATEGSHGINTDNEVKVYQGKGYMFGQCGECSDLLPLNEALKTTHEPFKLLKLLHSDEFKLLFKNLGVLVATSKHGCYSIDRTPHKDPNIEHDPVKRPLATIIPWTREALPQMVGSGYLHVRTLLAQHEVITPDIVKSAIETSYKVNHTIGGKITELKLKVK